MTKHDPIETLRQMWAFAEEAAGLALVHRPEDLDTNLSFRRHAERVAELIGESANRLPRTIQELSPEVPWREMIGMRNWLVHGYDGVDPEILWDVLKCHAPKLVSAIDTLLRRILPE